VIPIARQDDSAFVFALHRILIAGCSSQTPASRSPQASARRN
jgi:hypothetical protein